MCDVDQLRVPGAELLMEFLLEVRPISTKYIFSINTGRSGSYYLSMLLAKASNTVSFHEGPPMMIGSPMRRFNNGDEQELRALMPWKMREIQKKSSNGKKTYCEMNNSYIKGWGYLVPDEHIPQEEIGVIILRRDVEKIIHSLLRTRILPGASAWSRAWLLCPGEQRNFSQPPENAGRYELCQWYIEETNLRAQAYRKQFPRIKYVECDLEQLNDYDFVVEMFEQFDLTPTVALKDAVGETTNQMSWWPRLSLEELLAPPRYPSADDLPPEERDTLIADMIAYLHEHKAQEIAHAQGLSLFPAAAHIVTAAETELEDTFRYSLMLTEMEWILIFEFLHAIAPQDPMFVLVNRTPPPGIAHTFDLNILPHINLAPKMELSTAFRIAWLITKANLQGQDVMHVVGRDSWNGTGHLRSDSARRTLSHGVEADSIGY
jgi:hypothetical protein